MQDKPYDTLPPVERELLLNCAHHAFRSGLSQKDPSKIAQTFYLVYEAHNANILGDMSETHISLLKAANELVSIQRHSDQFFGDAIVMLTLSVLTALKTAT